MVFFMVFIACSKAADSDTMRGELMQSWYFVGAVQLRVLDRGWRYCGL
jgi:hypothetical protein